MSRRTTKALAAPKADVKRPAMHHNAPEQPAPAPEQEAVPAEQTVIVPASLLLAAEMVSSQEEQTRAYICGVHITSKDGVLTCCS